MIDTFFTQTLNKTLSEGRFKDRRIICVSDFSVRDNKLRSQYPDFVRNPRIKIQGEWECHKGTYLLNNDGSIDPI